MNFHNREGSGGRNITLLILPPFVHVCSHYHYVPLSDHGMCLLTRCLHCNTTVSLSTASLTSDHMVDGDGERFESLQVSFVDSVGIRDKLKARNVM